MDDINDFLGARDFSRSTRETYQFYLESLIACGEVEKMGAGELLAWLDHWPEASTSRYLACCAARSFIKWRYGENHPALKVRVKRMDPGPQRTLKLEQVQRLLATPDSTTPKGKRDLALLVLMLDTGLRASEVCRLELRHVDLAERTLQVITKGRQWGFRVYTQYTAAILEAWLPVRESLATKGVRTLFVSIGGLRPGRPLTKDGLRTITYKLAIKAGLEKFSPHALRRTFATLATRAGAPGKVVMVAGGWSNMGMVDRYTRAIEPGDIAPYSPVSRAMGIDLD